MTPTAYNMQPVVRGDRWNGIPTITILVNGQVPPIALASARMQFRKTAGPGAELTTENGLMGIVSAAGWELSIPAQSLPLVAGRWNYDIETTDIAGTVKTYVAGTILITEDITR